MRRKALLVLALFALGTMILQASGDRYLVYVDSRHLGANSDLPNGDFSRVTVINEDGAAVVQAGWFAETDAYITRGDGVIRVADLNGNPRAVMAGDVREGGMVVVYDTGGLPAAWMSANAGIWSKNGDLAENFPTSVAGIAPGSVLVLDSENPGRLTLSERPYDARVAGVVSGASDYKPGITLGEKDHVNGVPVTLTGTAYCRVTNANGAIKAGDLLTTSARPGYAMKATDREASHGAVLGKAMEDFDGESGLILILAALQ